MQDLKILGIQSDIIWENPKQNLVLFEEKINQSFDNHHLIILPETFTTGFPVDPTVFAEEVNGPSIIWMENIAKIFETTICGSILLNRKGKYSNSLIWMRSDGRFEIYDKRHVFSMGGENEKITAGSKSLIVEINGWKIKLFICYDLRFPVWSKNTYDKDYEYDMAIYVANWPEVRSYPWRQLLISRAIENMACVVGINRVGSDGLGINYSGNSMFIDAKGKILSEPKNNLEENISINFSANELLDFRSKFNVGLDWDNFEIFKK